MKIRSLSSVQPDFDKQLAQLLSFESTQDEKLEATVASILSDVRKRGDMALLEYTRRFDRLPIEVAASLEIPQTELKLAFDNLPTDQRVALEQAAQRVTS